MKDNMNSGNASGNAFVQNSFNLQQQLHHHQQQQHQQYQQQQQYMQQQQQLQHNVSMREFMKNAIKNKNLLTMEQKKFILNEMKKKIMSRGVPFHPRPSSNFKNINAFPYTQSSSLGNNSNNNSNIINMLPFPLTPSESNGNIIQQQQQQSSNQNGNNKFLFMSPSNTHGDVFGTSMVSPYHLNQQSIHQMPFLFHHETHNQLSHTLPFSASLGTRMIHAPFSHQDAQETSQQQILTSISPCENESNGDHDDVDEIELRNESAINYPLTSRIKRSLSEISADQDSVGNSSEILLNNHQSVIVSSTTHKKSRKLNNNGKDTMSCTSSTPSTPSEDFSNSNFSQLSEQDIILSSSSSSSYNPPPKFWTSEEDESLVSAVKLYGTQNWKEIALHVIGRSATQCQQRWSKVLVPGLKKGPWSQCEDDMLLSLAKQQIENQQRVLESASQLLGEKILPTSDRKMNFRINWKYISERIPGRTAKQCRARWVNNLNPDLKKDKWTEEEDNKILALYEAVGSRWSYIASKLDGRSENAVKIRYISLTRSKSNQSPDSVTESTQ